MLYHDDTIRILHIHPEDEYLDDILMNHKTMYHDKTVRVLHIHPEGEYLDYREGFCGDFIEISLFSAKPSHSLNPNSGA